MISASSTSKARRHVEARPWERLAPRASTWTSRSGRGSRTCAQLFRNGLATVIPLFPGHREMLDLQQARMAEPPAGTMLIELLDGERGVPALRMITPQGWTEPDRRQTLIANLVPLPATLRSAAPILAAPLR